MPALLTTDSVKKNTLKKEIASFTGSHPPRSTVFLLPVILLNLLSLFAVLYKCKEPYLLQMLSVRGRCSINIY